MIVREELALVRRAKKGEKEAMEILWDAITPKLYGYLVRSLGNKHLAEDMLQDTWLKAIEKIHQFTPRNVRFSSWLFAIARNECRQHWRKNKRHVDVDETEISNIPAGESHIDEHLMVDQLLQSLKEKDKDLLRLRYIADLSFKEIAKILSISVVAARVRMHRVLQKARTEVD